MKKPILPCYQGAISHFSPRLNLGLNRSVCAVCTYSIALSLWIQGESMTNDNISAHPFYVNQNCEIKYLILFLNLNLLVIHILNII